MDFNQGVSKTISKSRDGLTSGIVRYNLEDDIFSVIIKDKEYDVNAYAFDKAKVLFSKPTNDRHEHWTKSKGIPKKDNYNIVMKFWSTVKHNQKVRGIIEDNIFIIKKY